MTYQCTDPQSGTLIHAYELGALPSSDVRRFEAHLLECEHCFVEVEAFEEKAALLHSGRLVRRAIKDQLTDPDEVPALRRILNLLWPDTPLVLKPAILLLALMILFYPAYIGLVSSTDDSVRPVQSISLMPNRSASTGSLSVSAERDGLLSFVVPEVIPGQSYRLEIVSSGGKVLMSDASYSGFDAYRIGRLLIPAHLMKPGEYQLIIRDLEGDNVLSSGTFVFVIEE